MWHSFLYAFYSVLKCPALLDSNGPPAAILQHYPKPAYCTETWSDLWDILSSSCEHIFNTNQLH